MLLKIDGSNKINQIDTVLSNKKESKYILKITKH